MVNFVPLGERVIVQPIELDQQTKGGIFLPDTAKEKPQEGKVVAVGPGRVADDGTRIPKVKVPAKFVPDVIKQITSHYKEQKNDGESFNQFLDRVGLEQVGEIAAGAAAAAQSAASGSDLYFDWDRTNIYKLERGEGECAV